MYKHVITALAATATGVTLMAAPAAADDYDDRLREWCANATYLPHSPLRDVIGDDELVQYLTDDEYGRDGVRISYDRQPTAEEWAEINGYVHALMGQVFDSNSNADATARRTGPVGTVNVNGHVRGLITAPWCEEYNRRYHPHWADSYRSNWPHSYRPQWQQPYGPWIGPWTGPWNRPTSSATTTAPRSSSAPAAPSAPSAPSASSSLLDNIGVTGLLNSLGLSR